MKMHSKYLVISTFMVLFGRFIIIVVYMFNMQFHIIIFDLAVVIYNEILRYNFNNCYY